MSDNSALSALAEAGLTDLLPRLFGTVVIPEAVYREGPIYASVRLVASGVRWE